MTGAQIGYVGVDFGHNHVINGFKIKQRAGCGTSRVQLVHGHECGSQPCTTGGQIVATFRLNAAGGVFENATSLWLATGAPTAPSTAPTRPPSSSLPTTMPTVRPIVNTVNDCGRFHINCQSQLGSPYQGSGITCPMESGNLDGRCMCIGPYHCRGTEARGRCANPRDHCIERGITASPSSLPSSAPSQVPSTSPASSIPTKTPSSAPTTTPTEGPTMTYPTNTDGRPIFPTDSAGNEFYATDSSGQTIVPTDKYGRAFIPVTIPESVSSVPVFPIDSSNSINSSGSDDNGTVVTVVGIAVAIIIMVIVGALWYIRQNAGTNRNESGGFENPAYEPTPITWEVDGGSTANGYADIPATANGDAGDSGYMDVTQSSTEVAGYSDISPKVDDDVEEDV